MDLYRLGLVSENISFDIYICTYLPNQSKLLLMPLFLIYTTVKQIHYSTRYFELSCVFYNTHKNTRFNVALNQSLAL